MMMDCLETCHAKAKQLSFTCNGMQQEKELAEFCDVEDRCISTDLPTIFSHWLNSEKKAALKMLTINQSKSKIGEQQTNESLKSDFSAPRGKEC